mmetsp:Transcript_42473/g.106015  ORF Transcript_42473/g.106015 Transcript_42473/m.106015 type:complete len:89 (-) Transcript_42473:216-482(-)
MSDYTFASREGAEEAKAAVHTRLDFLPPQDEEGWPDRKHLSVGLRRDGHDPQVSQKSAGCTFDVSSCTVTTHSTRDSETECCLLTEMM